MLTKWMKRGLVSGLLAGAVILVAGCAQQQAPAPAPEPPRTEAPVALDTTIAPAAADTTAAPAAADTTKAAAPKPAKKAVKK